MPAATAGDAKITVEQAVKRLKEGNKHFVAGRTTHDLGKVPATRARLASGQDPFAIILGCSDSRVPVELIFDQGIGDLFVVRVAGNVASTEVVGSIQFAVEYLHAPLVVVMGHESCGAVTAAGGDFSSAPRELQKLLEVIRPVYGTLGADLTGDARTAAAVEANVRQSVRQLAGVDPLKSAMAEGKVKIVGAVYELKTGVVRFLEP